MKPPAIKVIDLIQRIAFDLGIALASTFSYRNGDYKTASYEFYKSCLFGLRCLEILKLKKFPLTFDDIYKLSKRLKLGREYEALVLTAYKARQGKKKIKELDVFTNISFLNDFIEPQIIKYFKKNGNKVLIK